MPRKRSRDVDREKFWRRVIGGQARSGLSISVWCRKQGLSEPSFYWWRSRLARTGRTRKPRFREPTLVPVRVSQPEVGSAEGLIEIALPDERRIQVRGRVDREALAAVLAVLTVDRAGPPGLEAPPC